MHKTNSIDKKKHSVASPHTHYENRATLGQDVMGFKEKQRATKVGRGEKQTADNKKNLICIFLALWFCLLLKESSLNDVEAFWAGLEVVGMKLKLEAVWG